MKSYESSAAIGGLNDLATDINQWAKDKGFWEPPYLEPHSGIKHMELQRLIKTQKIMLVVTELAELVEGLRLTGEAARVELVPGSREYFTNEEEEVADAIIRLLDYAGQYGLRVGEALVAKMAKNETRPHKHGKEF